MTHLPDEPTNEERWPPESGLPSRSRFKKAKALGWGETPFDTLSRAELLRLVQAYHMAVTATSSCLRMQEAVEPDSPYWDREEGSGGRALKKAEHLIKLCGDGGQNEASERIYRSFFRTAHGLFFGAKPGSFDDWCIKVDGNEMYAPFRDDPGYRRIEWRDLLPNQIRKAGRG